MPGVQGWVRVHVVRSDGGGFGFGHHHMNLLRKSLLLFIVGGTACSVQAEPGRTPVLPTDVSRAGRPAGIAAALDTDHDGVLSVVEITHSALILAALDVDDDGVLSAAELRDVGVVGLATDAGRIPTLIGRGGRVFPECDLGCVLDANHDGDIQPMEIANAPASLLTLDANSDGRLTADELEIVATTRRNGG